jgi:hypothetical protein
LNNLLHVLREGTGRTTAALWPEFQRVSFSLGCKLAQKGWKSVVAGIYFQHSRFSPWRNHGKRTKVFP